MAETFASLRSFIEYLQRQGQLVTNDKQVSLNGEVAAISRRVALTQGPAVLHNNLRGYPGWRLFTDGLVTRERQAWILGVPVKGMVERVSTFLSKGDRLQPRLVASGPVQELKFTGDEVDLTRLPLVQTGQYDLPPYITAGVSNVRDPETGWQNTGIRRFQLKGPQRLNHCMLPQQQEGQIFLKYVKAGRPMPIAIVIGGDPLYYLISQMPVPPQVDEMDYWGAFTGEPLEVVRAETSDILVPAQAEIVLEGEVDPVAREPEGPFSEFSGYYSGVRYFPVIHIHTVTMRRQPIYYNMYNGLEPCEGTAFAYTMTEIEMHRQVRQLIPEVRDIRILSGWGMVMAVSVDRQAVLKRPGLAKKVGMAIKALPASGFVKTIIITDDSVNIQDPSQVWWALAVKFQGGKDLTVIPGVPGSFLDPSEPWLGMGQGYTTLTLCDCTEPPPPYDEGYRRGLSAPPADFAALVEERWSEYGFR